MFRGSNFHPLESVSYIYLHWNDSFRSVINAVCCISLDCAYRWEKFRLEILEKEKKKKENSFVITVNATDIIAATYLQ